MTEYNPHIAAHAFARDIIIETIRARGELIAGSVPDEKDAEKLSRFITKLYDQTVAHFSQQE